MYFIRLEWTVYVPCEIRSTQSRTLAPKRHRSTNGTRKPVPAGVVTAVARSSSGKTHKRSGIFGGVAEGGWGRLSGGLVS